MCCLLAACQRADTPPDERVIDRRQLVAENKYIATRDFDVMRHFVARKGWRMKFADEGYYYEIFDGGASPKIADRNRVTFTATVALLDGTECYRYDRRRFVVGASEEISGLHHAVCRLGKGGRARFIFPPILAFGLLGDFDRIPPRAVLIYNVEIIDNE
jgi:FKBP-type peptidyl-prolyl cis-trans isomerase